ncbi:MAG: alpha/beta hydrolase [Acidimicrobiia bacterium]|nr:alpha/beta hydrolase [Acidimicrobiia bacterium]
MSLHVRRFGRRSGQPIVFVAGFGDHGGMFEALGDTVLGERYTILGVDLPGTGLSKPWAQRLTLQVAGELIAEVVHQEEATIIVGHSVGSVVASLAALTPDSSIRTVLSIEGNLTPADAYFSGSAAEYESAAAFRAAFLARLDEMAVDSPSVQRYREQVAAADPRSIWELGCDVAEWSRAQQPGDVLVRSADRVRYLFNPDNTPAESLDWLRDNEIVSIRLDGAGHWMAVDEPDLMAQKLLEAIAV